MLNSGMESCAKLTKVWPLTRDKEIRDQDAADDARVTTNFVE